MAEQYFSAEPTSKDVRRTLNVTLQGREVPVETSNGVFSGSRLDLGTSVLLREVPEPPSSGAFLDLGCGWGPVALSLAFAAPAADVWAVDVNERALELTVENAKRNGCGNVHATRTDESGVPAAAQPAVCETMPDGLLFDVIWSNPPIRIGKEALHTLLMAWLPRLKPDGGVAYLVVQKNLGADSLVPWLAGELGEGYEVSKYHSAKGYRVIEVVRNN
ncbi:class I SAM-dependent methyltransferase [Bifidobacterium amazonense]|uniref:Class I SAM-dependent methyltransferase n=1 Tax=Bifidobacterium amazonense TaxID=2809027 RepID=A0ABS9VRC2_9BIFI|nr:methyltransferase [Bifidobacterium amazonense]MCH9274705.1 class I SAM-dependent methyltransferase [Bifidobacterium amazonense]